MTKHVEPEDMEDYSQQSIMVSHRVRNIDDAYQLHRDDARDASRVWCNETAR